MKRKRLKERILWLSASAWLIFVLFLTLQNGNDTAEISGKMAQWIYQLLMKFGVNVVYSKLHQGLRTTAHFLVFCVFGVLFESAVLASLKRVRFIWAYLPALLICAGISVIAEVMKVWIPGRHLQWNEVLINIAGVCVGVFGVYVIWRISLFCHERRKLQ